MDIEFAEAVRKQYAECLFETVRHSNCEANKEYIAKQIKIVSEYLTNEQKDYLNAQGIDI